MKKIALNQLKECLIKDGKFVVGEKEPKLPLFLSDLVFHDGKIGEVVQNYSSESEAANGIVIGMEGEEYAIIKEQGKGYAEQSGGYVGDTLILRCKEGKFVPIAAEWKVIVNNNSTT